MKVIYKIIFPNGKIYVGKDLTGTLHYFGSPDSHLIEQDFSAEEQRDFSVRKQILWESLTASNSEVNCMEVSFIRALRSNEPAVGYNQWPKPPGRSSPSKKLSNDTEKKETPKKGRTTKQKISKVPSLPPAAPKAAAEKTAWPAKNLPAQIAAVRDLIQNSNAAWTAETVARSFKNAQVKSVQPVLESLAAIGLLVSFKKGGEQYWKAAGGK